MNFSLTQGDQLPALEDTLIIDGVAVDLTGAQVFLSYQNEATGRVRTVGASVVSPATSGKVRYSWDTVDTSDVGDCVGQWKVVFSDGKPLTFPSEPFPFRLRLPVSTLHGIAAFRQPIRTMLGDNHPDLKQYAADQIDDAIRLVVNLGKIPNVVLAADGMNLVPPVKPINDLGAVDQNWARIILYAVKIFVMPNSSTWAYRTRALSEVFGENKHLVLEILQEIYDLEAGGGVL